MWGCYNIKEILYSLYMLVIYQRFRKFTYLFFAFVIFSAFIPVDFVSSAGSTPVLGEATFMNSGLIMSFDSATYNSNVVISDPDAGNSNVRTITGWAWSEGFGWIYFDSVTVDYASGELSGQANVANTGSYIDFSNNNSNAYIDPETGEFGGYGWSIDGGWIDFSDSGVYVEETGDPANPISVSGFETSAKENSVESGGFANSSSPYFEWSGASDSSDSSGYASGVDGYWIYFGTDETANPTTAGSYQSESNLTVSSELTSGTSYYLRLVTQDVMGNRSAAETVFEYNYDSSSPNAPEYVNVNPAGCSTTTNFEFSWEEPSDVGGSGIWGYQYKVGSTGDLVDIEGAGINSVSADSYQEGDNVFYLRSVDNAGNNSSWVTGVYCSTASAQVVDGPEVKAGPASINVSWTSNKKTTSYVRVYQGNQYVSEQGHTSYDYSHQVEVVGLKAEQDYRYRLVWSDENGNLGQSSWYTTNTSRTPRIIDLKTEVLSPTSVLVSFETNYLSTAKIEYGPNSYEEEFNLSGKANSFSTQIQNLEAGTDYKLGIKATTDDGAEYSAGSTFSTPPLPEISNLSFQSVEDAPSATVEVSWETNTKTSSAVEIRPVEKNVEPRFVSSTKMVQDHTLTIEGLADQTEYSLTASGRDRYGNQAVSDNQTFTTKEDSRPPKISDIRLETSIIGIGAESKAQIVVSWQTDEPATSQVEYGIGVGGSSYQQTTNEDSSLTKSHTVIISELDSQRTYHLRPISKDGAGNENLGSDNVVITGKAQESILDIIVGKLKETFGFLADIRDLI